MQTNEMFDVIKTVNNNWENFRDDYKNTVQQVAQLHAFLGRPTQLGNNFNLEKSQMSNYLRKGELTMELKNNYLASNNGGAGLIVPSISNKIIADINLLSPMRKIASVESISSNELEVFSEDGQFEAGWVSEEAERKTTTTPKLKQQKITLHELYATPMATQRLLEDAAIDIERWIEERLVDAFIRLENDVFINGNGENKPTGILQNQGIKTVNTQDGQKICVQDILNLLNQLPECYFANAAFLMNRATLAYIQTLQDENGRFIWQPAYVESQPQTLFGIPVYCCGQMPTIQQGGKVIALADFKNAYKIVDRNGILIMRDHYTSPPFIKFYATKRVGADVVNTNAIKILTCTK